jgi:putative hydrolase of HD superfamily
MSRDVDFLFEIGALRFQPRQWQRFLLTDVANITEHHYRVMWLALIIAGRQTEPVNTEKLLKMAMAHDIAESRTGDVDYISRQYAKLDEERAAHDMLKNTNLHNEFTELIHEYEQRDCLEAKIVKDADNLDVDLEIREQGARGASLEAAWAPHRKKIAATRFFTASAKELYEEIAASDPNAWHTTSPNNRVNGGDWKETI